MSTTQIAVRMPDMLLAQLDRLVAVDVFESRAAAVRAGVESVTAEFSRHEIDRAIVEGYRRVPPDRSERATAPTRRPPTVSVQMCKIVEQPAGPLAASPTNCSRVSTRCHQRT